MNPQPPDRTPPGTAPASAAPLRIHAEELRFRSGPPTHLRRGGKGGPILAATLYLPADAAPDRDRLPGLIVGHGAGSRRGRHDSFCREACAAGMAVLALDFRGHGDSTGTADGPLQEDILAAAALLRSHPLIDGHRLGYRGSSMGGYYGLLAAADAGFAAAALICPASEEVLLAGVDRPAAVTFAGNDPTQRLDRERLREYLRTHPALAAAGDVTCPVLLLHARGDDVVPLRHTLALAERLAGPVDVVITPGGDHRSIQASPVMHRRVALWLREQLTS